MCNVQDEVPHTLLMLDCLLSSQPTCDIMGSVCLDKTLWLVMLLGQNVCVLFVCAWLCVCTHGSMGLQKIATVSIFPSPPSPSPTCSGVG